MVVGCGYVGVRVASRWLNRGDVVFAITRTRDRASELSRLGIRPIIWDWLSCETPVRDGNFESLSDISTPEFATILVAVSHSPQIDLPPTETHSRGLNHLENLLAAVGRWERNRSKSKWIYLSTTGVFAPSLPGAWLDEDSPVFPERPGSVAALAGENWIAEHIPAGQYVILRPVGIYGPDRVPRWQSIRDQVPLQVDPESYLNLIHVDDLASTVAAVADQAMQSLLYCVSDGTPVRRREYYEYISTMGNWPGPLFEDRDRTTASSRLRSDGNKRIRNQRIQSELAVSLAYPSYREGLKTLLQGAMTER